MRPAEFSELLDTYGADPERWPAGLRAAALAHRDADPAARAAWEHAAALDALLAAPRPGEAARAAAVVDAALRRLRAEGDRPGFWPGLWQEWRWLLARPLGAGLAAMVVIGWLAGHAPPIARGAPVIDLLLTDPSLFEDLAP